jgi:hypothetical protein
VDTSSFERCSDLRRAETPSELLLVTDLWDRSARHLLDDRKRRIKVARSVPLHRIVAASLVGLRRSWVLRMAIAPQVSEALFILREAANGLRVLHGHKVRPRDPGVDEHVRALGDLAG